MFVVPSRVRRGVQVDRRKVLQRKAHHFLIAFIGRGVHPSGYGRVEGKTQQIDYSGPALGLRSSEVVAEELQQGGKGDRVGLYGSGPEKG